MELTTKQLKKPLDNIGAGYILATVAAVVPTIIISIVFGLIDGWLTGASGAGDANTIASELTQSVNKLVWVIGVAFYLIKWLVALILIAKTNRVQLKPLFLKSNRGLAYIIPVMLVAIGAARAVSALTAFLDSLLGEYGLSKILGDSLVDFDTVTTSVISIFLVCVAAPILEELVFRGAILQSLRRYGDKFAIIFSAVFFGLVHGNILQAPMAAALGIFLAILTIKCKSIIPSIITHFIFNSIGLAEILLAKYYPAQEEKTGLIILAVTIALALIGAVLWKTVLKNKFENNESNELSLSEESSVYKGKGAELLKKSAPCIVVFVLLLIAIIGMSLMPAFTKLSEQALQSLAG